MKNIKLHRFACAGLMALIAAFSSCSEEETYDVMGNDGLVYARADTGNPSTGFLDLTVSQNKFGMFGTDGRVSFPIRTTMPAKSDVEVICKIDNSLLAVYNQKYGTEYRELSSDMLLVSNSSFVIKRASMQCDSRVEISFNQEAIDKVEVGEYLVPFRLEMVSGDMEISKMYSTIYTHVKVEYDPTGLKIPFADRTKWTVVDCSSEETVGEDAAAINAFDGNDNTYWHTAWSNNQPRPPHHITIDMGGTVKLVGFQYKNRLSGSGCSSTLRVEISLDNKTWTEIDTYNDLPQDGREEFKVILDDIREARYLKYITLSSRNYYIAMSEINAITVK